MNSNTLSGQTHGPTYYPKGSAAQPEAAANADPANVEPRGLDEDVKKLRRDMATLTDTLSRLGSQVGGEAAKAVRSAKQSLSAQVSSAADAVVDASSDLAASAKGHAKTFASELEGMARRNPLGTIAGALIVGVVIGMMSRGRG